MANAEPQPVGVKRSSRLRSVGLVAVSIGLAITVWEVVSLYFPAYLIPGPSETLSVLWGDILSGAVLTNSIATLQRVVIGFALALLSGVGVGIAMGLRKTVDGILRFIVLIVLSIPGPSLAIIFLMWFGLNGWAAVAFSYAVAFPLIAINVQEGVKNIDTELVEMARSYKASPFLVLTSVIFRGVLPYIWSASRTGFGIALKIAVFAELFGVTSGLGYELYLYYSFFDMPQVFAWSVVFTTYVLIFDVVVFRGLEPRLFRWRNTVTR